MLILLKRHKYNIMLLTSKARSKTEQVHSQIFRWSSTSFSWRWNTHSTRVKCCNHSWTDETANFKMFCKCWKFLSTVLSNTICHLMYIAQCCKVLRKKKHKHLHNWKWKVPGNFPHLVTSSLQAEGISTLRIPLNTENRLVVLPIIK